MWSKMKDYFDMKCTTERWYIHNFFWITKKKINKLLNFLPASLLFYGIEEQVVQRNVKFLWHLLAFHTFFIFKMQTFEFERTQTHNSPPRHPPLQVGVYDISKDYSCDINFKIFYDIQDGVVKAQEVCKF